MCRFFFTFLSSTYSVPFDGLTRLGETNGFLYSLVYRNMHGRVREHAHRHAFREHRWEACVAPVPTLSNMLMPMSMSIQMSKQRRRRCGLSCCPLGCWCHPRVASAYSTPFVPREDRDTDFNATPVRPHRSQRVTESESVSKL